MRSGPHAGHEKRSTIRAFFAVALDVAARQAAADVADALRLAPRGDAVRWVRPEGLHVTLRFLGEIPPERVEVLSRNVAPEVARLAPFRMELGAVRLFPAPRRPRAVILDVAPEARLVELAAAVERGVSASGFEPEGRTFQPHLTLGRVRSPEFPEMASTAPPAGSGCQVAEALLLRSELLTGGARYKTLERFPLAGARD